MDVNGSLLDNLATMMSGCNLIIALIFLSKSVVSYSLRLTWYGIDMLRSIDEWHIVSFP